MASVAFILSYTVDATQTLVRINSERFEHNHPRGDEDIVEEEFRQQFESDEDHDWSPATQSIDGPLIIGDITIDDSF